MRVNRWVREYVPPPHFFFGIDRSQATGQFTHVREKARGLVAGIPDTVLLCPNLPAIAVELKAPGNRPSDAQELVRDKITAAGHIWRWTDTVRGYAAILADSGIALRPGWLLAAERSDAMLEGAAIQRKAAKPKRQPRPRPISVPPELPADLADLFR
ncbi:MAG TPA: hypothetical protein VHO91_10840 [Rhodopila sp.]|nr:hypothetical protein [Rhodopila sp.]